MVSRYAAALVPCLVLCSLPALYARALELEGLSGPRPLSWHSTGSIDEDVRPVTRGGFLARSLIKLQLSTSILENAVTGAQATVTTGHGSEDLDNKSRAWLQHSQGRL